MVNWSSIRQQFPAVKRYVYLDAAAGSPIPKSVAREAKKFYDQMLTEGDVLWHEWLKKIEGVRQSAADLIGADKEEIAFTHNTSTGMNIIAQMLIERGDVLTMQDEFPASTLPWLHRKFPVLFIGSKNCTYPIDYIESAITRNTRILVTSHVQYCTGFRQDLVALGKLCKEKDLIYVVNATQSAGVMPIDVKKANIDFLVFKSMKWLLGGYETGVLYMNKKWFGKLDYPDAGWRSVKTPGLMDNRRLDLKQNVAEIELGCPHLPNIFAMGAAIDFLSKIGIDNVQKRIFELNDYLATKLKRAHIEIISPLAKKHRSGITIIDVPNPREVVSKLEQQNIITSARGGGLRVSIHIYNNRRDIDKFIAALGRACDS